MSRTKYNHARKVTKRSEFKRSRGRSETTDKMLRDMNRKSKQRVLKGYVK